MRQQYVNRHEYGRDAIRRRLKQALTPAHVRALARRTAVRSVDRQPHVPSLAARAHPMESHSNRVTVGPGPVPVTPLQSACNRSPKSGALGGLPTVHLRASRFGATSRWLAVRSSRNNAARAKDGAPGPPSLYELRRARWPANRSSPEIRASEGWRARPELNRRPPA